MQSYESYGGSCSSTSKVAKTVLVIVGTASASINLGPQQQQQQRGQSREDAATATQGLKKHLTQLGLANLPPGLPGLSSQGDTDVVSPGSSSSLLPGSSSSFLPTTTQPPPPLPHGPPPTQIPVSVRPFQQPSGPPPGLKKNLKSISGT